MISGWCIRVLGDVVVFHRAFVAALADLYPRDGVLGRLLGQPLLFEGGAGLRDEEVPLVGGPGSFKDRTG